MHLLFDLDGTIADSFPGISRSINQTLATLGREPVAPEDLRQFVGARLTTIFGALLSSDDHVLIDRAVEIYRPLFDEVGIFESRVFPGIPDALTTLRAAGHSMQVVTVRSIDSARLVVNHFGLDRYFDGVHGPPRSERACNKADLVRAALDAAGVHPSQAAMIGDRADDIRAARAHTVTAVAVTWGYGSDRELRDMRPDYVATSIADLVDWVQKAVTHSSPQR